MLEEKWTKQFLANNPSLTERMKKLEGQCHLESVIMTDLGYLVAYQQSFSTSFSICLVRLQKFVNFAAQQLISEVKFRSKYQEFSHAENSIHLINLANQLQAILFQIAEKTLETEEDMPSLREAHTLFDEIAYFRNLICTKYRNIFSPLPLFRIQNPESHISKGDSIFLQVEKSEYRKKSRYNRNDSKNVNKDNHKPRFLKMLSSPFFDMSFFEPNKRSFQQFKNSIGDHRKKKQNLSVLLTKLCDDLNRTVKELNFLKCDYQASNILAQDFTLFPPFDVVRESPVFNELNNSIYHTLNYVRTEVSELYTKTAKTVKFISKLCGLSGVVLNLPQFDSLFESFHTLNFYDAKHRLTLFRNIIRSSEVFKESVPDYISFKYIQQDHSNFKKLNEFQEKDDYNALSQFVESILDNYVHISDDISSEIDEIEQKTREIEEKRKQWLLKRVQPLTDDTRRKKEVLLKKTEQLKRKIKSDKELANSLLLSTVKYCKEITSDLKLTKPLFPYAFEDMLTNTFEKAPKLEWVNQKLTHQQRLNEQILLAIENTKQNYSDLREEIAEKKKILESLQKSSNPDKPKPSHISKCLCPVCKCRQRDIIITNCGHTFCKKCVEILQRNGYEKCPHCNTPFEENNVKLIHWK